MAGTTLQVPGVPAMAHDMHLLEQAVVQQVLSTQNPVAHWEPLLQARPGEARQAPLPSQRKLPTQGVLALRSGINSATGWQAPCLPVNPHDMHDPIQASAQQWPSVQKPLPHWEAEVQVVPLAPLQVPLPSHALVPEQGLVAFKSNLPGGTSPQVPTLVARLQALQLAVQDSLQQ